MLRRFVDEKIGKHQYLFLLVVVFMYIVSSVVFLNLPGINEDEAYHVGPLLTVLKGHGGSFLSLRLGGHSFFVLLNAWTGPIVSYLFFPLISCFGFSVYVIRFARIFYGAVTLVVFYFFAKEFFNKRIAQTAVFLLATLPFYIFSYRHGHLDDGILPTFVLLALLCFYHFYKRGQSKFLFVGALSCGLGLTSKLNFSWFLIAFVCAVFGFRKKIGFYQNKKNYILAGLMFLLAFSPFIVYNSACLMKAGNVNVDNRITKIVGGNMGETYLGQDNRNLLSNVFMNIRQLKYLFNSTSGGFDYSNYARAIRNPIYAWFVFFVFGVYLLKYKKWKKEYSKIYFLLTIIFIVFCFKNYTVSTFRINHYLLILPLIVLVVAHFIHRLCEKYHYGLGVVVLAVLTFFNYLSLGDHYRLIANESIVTLWGYHYSSSSIYQLNDFLQENEIYSPILVGEENGFVLEVLSEAKITPLLYNMDHPLEELDPEGDDVYIYNFDCGKNVDFHIFQNIVKKAKKSIVIEKIFYRKNNSIAIVVLKLDGNTKE